MNREYYSCSAGEDGKNYDEENLNRIRDGRCFVLNEDARKGTYENVAAGDILLLKFRGKFVAYGEALGRSEVPDKDGWSLRINVKEWYFHDAHDPQQGVSISGLKDANFGGPYDTVKHVETDFGQRKVSEMGLNSELHQAISDEGYMNQLLDLLRASHQVILTGAPGTGKTFLARQIVRQDAEELRSEFVQFHPSYDYTDFVEGLKPYMADKQVGFRLHNGIFKEFCRKAGVIERALYDKLRGRKCNDIQVADLNHIKVDHSDDNVRRFWNEWLDQARSSGKVELPPFYFIIDEINRADLSRVFGELFYALEPSYRGPNGAVKTQYSAMNTPETCFLRPGDDEFFVPSNVYIIGTMNDIDRSVESMDFALRRRFAWYEVPADEACFSRISAKLGDVALNRYLSLNKAIAEMEGLGTAYQIGPAYFLNLKPKEGQLLTEEDFGHLWGNHLKMLLNEYVRGMSNVEERLGRLKDAYNKQ